MLTLETIMAEALFTVELDTIWGRHWEVGSLEECNAIAEAHPDEFSDCDVVWWEQQPQHLQEFFKAYMESRIYLLKDFYEVWSKAN